MEKSTSLSFVQSSERFFTESRLQRDGIYDILLSQPEVASGLEDTLEEQKRYLLDMMGILAAYMEKKYSNNPQEIYNIDIWEQVLSHLPLMNMGRFTSLQLDRQVENMADALMLLRGGPQKVSLSIIIEAIKVASEIELLPKIRTNLFQISQEEFEKLVLCSATGEPCTVKIEVRESVCLFNYKALRKEEVRKSFEKFLQNTPKIDITTWRNFFIVTYPISLMDQEVFKRSMLTENTVHTLTQANHNHGRIAELERMVGHLTMQLEGVK
jgi:hypothetical protein